MGTASSGAIRGRLPDWLGPPATHALHHPDDEISHALVREAEALPRTTFPILTQRLRDTGFRFRHTPAAVTRHAAGHAVATLSLQERLSTWYARLLRYAEKHSSRGCLHCV